MECVWDSRERCETGDMRFCKKKENYKQTEHACTPYAATGHTDRVEEYTVAPGSVQKKDAIHARVLSDVAMFV